MVDNLKFDLIGKIAQDNNYTWLQGYNQQNNNITVPLSFSNTNAPVSENSLAYIQRKLPAQVQIDVSNIPQQVEPKNDKNPLMLADNTEIDFENFSISNVPVDNRRIDKDKNYRKQVRNALVQQFMTNGTVSNPTAMSKKDAEKLADRYIENMRDQANFLGTVTYIDKDAYNKAKKDRKAAYKDLVKQYRAEGMSRGDAKRKADYMLARVERVKNDDALRIINDPQYKDLFKDENGQFSSTRLKQFTLGLANTHTGTDEVTNYHLSLKERREMAARMGWDDDALCELAHRSGLDFEKDYTEVLQIAVALGGVAVGAGTGALLNRTITAGASSTAGDIAGAVVNGVGGAGASSSASGAAGVRLTKNYALEGAGIGGAIGGTIAPFVKDNGGTEPDVVAPAEPPKAEPQKEEPPKQEPPTICELEPEELHQNFEVPVSTCEYSVQPGDNWSKVVLAKYRVKTGVDAEGNPITRPVTNKEARTICRELKMVHGIGKDQFKDCIFFKPYSKVVDGRRMYVGELQAKGLLTDEDRASDAYKSSVMSLPEQFDGLYDASLKDMEFIVECDAKTDGKFARGPMKGKPGTVGNERNVAKRDQTVSSYWYTDCDNNRSEIYSTAAERDAAMRQKQQELNSNAK